MANPTNFLDCSFLINFACDRPVASRRRHDPIHCGERSHTGITCVTAPFMLARTGKRWVAIQVFLFSRRSLFTLGKMKKRLSKDGAKSIVAFALVERQNIDQGATFALSQGHVDKTVQQRHIQSTEGSCA